MRGGTTGCYYVVIRRLPGKVIEHKRWPMVPAMSGENTCMAARMSAKMVSGEVWMETPAICAPLP